MGEVKKILLTGATGFLGSHLLKRLVNEGYEVVAIKRSTSDLFRLRGYESKVDFIDVDLVGLENISWWEEIDAVINTAVCYDRHNESIAEVVNANILFSVKLLELAVKNNVKLFINTDTFSSRVLQKSLSESLSGYNLSKKQFREWLELFASKIKIANMVLEHVYGEYDDDKKFVPWLILKLLENESRIELTSGEQMRDFIYIEDVVEAYICVLKNANCVHGFNNFEVGSGKSISIREFAELVCDMANKSKNVLCFGTVPNRINELFCSNADIAAIHSIGWRQRYILTSGLERVIKHSKNIKNVEVSGE